jgi:predicted CoA-binding protein
MDDTQIAQLLTTARTIAVFGHSADPWRTSYQIAGFLRRAGYTVYAVNPTVAQIDGEVCYPSLADVPVHIDIVNVFRRSEYLADVVREAVTIGAGSVWAQLSVEHRDAWQVAQAANMPLIMDRCIKIEYMRLDVERV